MASAKSIAASIDASTSSSNREGGMPHGRTIWPEVGR
jgi:hypothetical protein